MFSIPFPKEKPEWLVNPLTGRRLELDGYNREKNIAFEYQGPRHFETHWIKESAEKQIRRDQIKVQKCAEHGVSLIIMPYWIPKRDWKKEIKRQLDLSGKILIII